MKFRLDDGRFVAGFSSRVGGVSVGEYRGLNLALHVGDEPHAVLKNREILAANLGVSLSDLVFMNQVHGSEICVIDSAFMTRFRADLRRVLKELNLDFENGLDLANSTGLKFGLDRSNLAFGGENSNLAAKISEQINAIFPICDGLVTDLAGVGLCVMVADCSPVILVDEKRGAIGVAHAGRAGVMEQICTKTVAKMAEIYSSKASDLRVFVGANIKGDCYEIGGLDLGEFNRYKRDGKFDMNAALKDEFAELGVGSVKFDAACTHCEERYFSYRRDGVTGRFAGFAMIKDTHSLTKGGANGL